MREVPVCVSQLQGVVYVDVEATVAKPEKVDLSLTNNFSFAFTVRIQGLAC